MSIEQALEHEYLSDFVGAGTDIVSGIYNIKKILKYLFLLMKINKSILTIIERIFMKLSK